MRVFKVQWFTRFSRQEEISNETLAEAVGEVEQGLLDADLGGGLIKKRVAREGGGKHGGYRTVIAYRAETRAVFLYGFSKNAKENLTKKELNQYRTLAQCLLRFTDADIERARDAGVVEEVTYSGKKT